MRSSLDLVTAAMSRARARAYAFLSDVVARGIHRGNLDEARAWPEFEELLGPEDRLEAWAVRHERAFGRNLFPLEAVFLDPEAQPGGNASRRVQDTLSRVGYSWDPKGPSPDHLAVELGALGFVSAAEADALAAGREAEARRARAAASELLGGHVCVWLVPLVEAVCDHDDPLFVRVLGLVEALLVDHAEHVGLGGSELQRPPFGPGPPLSRLVEDPATGLDRMVDHILTPNACGAFWSVDRIVRLGRGRRLPGGFGSRRQRLRTLIATAADHGRAEVVFDDVRRELEGARRRMDRKDESELLAAAAVPWLERLDATIDGLDRARAMLSVAR